MALYELHVGSKDHIGMNFVENIIDLASKGAYQKEGTLPRMVWPFKVVMMIESEETPAPSAHIRVFDVEDNCKEIFSLNDSEQPTGFSFDMDSKLTKDQIDALEWKEFKDVCKKVGITGRDRNQMTKKFIDYQESQE